ncbi:hypothetical protein V8F20_009533 [Naviculisporaceae sp. PSN 640]
MAPTMAQGHVNEQAAGPAFNDNDLWDRIESKHWEQIRDLYLEEDRQLEDDYNSIAEKLYAEKMQRHDENIAIVRQIKELQERLLQLKKEDEIAEGERRELDRKFQATRLAIQARRDKEDREKRELFKQHRRSTPNAPREILPVAANSLPTLMERPAPLADRPPPPAPAKTPVETVEKQVQIKEVKMVQVAETHAPAAAKEESVDQAVRVQESRVQVVKHIETLTNGDAMDVDNDQEVAKNRVDMETIPQAPNGSGEKNGIPATNGTDLHVPQASVDGTLIQQENPVQNDIPVQNGTPVQNGAPVQNGTPVQITQDISVQQSIETDQHEDGRDTAATTCTIVLDDTSKVVHNDIVPQSTSDEDRREAQNATGAPAAPTDVKVDETEQPQSQPTARDDKEARNGANTEDEKDAQENGDAQKEMPVETQNTTEDIPNAVSNVPTDSEHVLNDRETHTPQQDGQDPMDIDESVEANNGGPPQRPRLDTESSSELTSAHSTPLASPTGYHTQAEDTSKPVTPVDQHFNGVEVYDGSGKLVGTVRHLKLENKWVELVKSLPIKRPVEIRPGRKFTAENLETIYEPSDAKGAKWLSCYIQATGEVQGQPCHTCTKPVGVFSQCVILGVEGFPRCGNCEWNRQGCNGASLLPRSRQSMGEESPSKSPSKAKPRPPPVSTGGFTPVNNSASGQKARSPMEDVHKATKTAKGTPSQPKAGRKSLPSGSTQKSKAQPETPLATTPTTGSPAESRGVPDDLEEIDKSVIEFEDDGKVFTKPGFMAGVPLEKISPDHPYWDPHWTDLGPAMSTTLKKWEEKLENHVKNGSAAASKFLANRQVNRGKAILEFLQEGELHPYQIVGKKYINKGLASYDTVFRLVQVLGELRKFQIDITPSQWLRHRLYEIWKEQGDDFNLGRTVHNLYHDPKVSAIRAKSGFGNIGRPSGYRMGQDEQPKRGSRAAKRKEPHGTPKSTPQRRKSVSVPKVEESEETEQLEEQPVASSSSSAPITRPRSSHRKSRGVSAEQQVQHDVQKEEAKVTQGTPSKKHRARTEVEAEDLMYDGYTSSDSFSKDHVMPVDWRVHQVKHAKISTNTCVTQYWHFVDPADGGEDHYVFEHQVLKDVLPNRVAWGVYKEPYDFHLRLNEITEATFARDCDHVIIGTKEIPGVVYRGDVMVAFKRPRTRKRFLSFLRKKGIKLVRTSKEYVEKAWNEMDSDVLPHYDSDG